MTNPTSNFNWQMPTASDLVTDLPADFETFGQAVDTTLADLKGGTSGQILAKASNTDMDFTWVTNDVGDITAVTAGTGISGGGTSGAVTITNSMATEIAAKGDLIAGTGSQTFDNLTVGTNGTSLVADSTAATGLKWGRPTAPGVLLYKSDQTTSGSTETTLSFNYEAYDTSGFHDNSTNNSRITIPAGLGGTYLVSCQWAFANNATGQRVGYLFVNGGTLYNLSVNVPVNATAQANINYTIAVKLSAGDYIEMKSFQDSGGNLVVNGNALYYTNFQATLIGE